MTLAELRELTRDMAPGANVTLEVYDLDLASLARFPVETVTSDGETVVIG